VLGGRRPLGNLNRKGGGHTRARHVKIPADRVDAETSVFGAAPAVCTMVATRRTVTVRSPPNLLRKMRSTPASTKKDQLDGEGISLAVAKPGGQQQQSPIAQIGEVVGDK
jgi:hypothetical protein